RWDDAHAAFTKGIELRPDHASVWAERSNLLTLLGLWDLAAVDYAREFERREPDTTFRWLCHGPVRLQLGGREGYRQLCRRMRERFQGTSNLEFAPELVRACLLSPDADSGSAPLLECAEHFAVSEHRSGYQLYILGTAYFRAGRHELAISRLRE